MKINFTAHLHVKQPSQLRAEQRDGVKHAMPLLQRIMFKNVVRLKKIVGAR